MYGFCVLVVFVCADTVKVVKTGKTISYHGYKAMEIRPQGGRQVEILKALELESGVDFWVPPVDAVPATAMLAPKAAHMFVSTLKHNNITYNMTINNLGKKFEEERQLQKIASNLIKKENLKMDLSHMMKYLRYSEIQTMLRKIAADHNETATLMEIGRSFEQRPLLMLKLSTNPGANKPIVFVEAGMHAREWLSPALALFTISQLMANRTLLDKQDWYILPVSNPDGYEYSHTKDRLWRKTRSYRPSISRYCVGTDPNRNFDVYWAKVGTSADPCDETYPGKHPFSEPETRAIRDIAYRLQKRLKTYLSLHSYGRFILYPWGYTTALPDNWSDLEDCGMHAAEAISAVRRGPLFTVGSPAQVLYASAGASDDYVTAAFKTPYAYTVELQGGGCSGFDPPPSAIHTMVQEAFPGILHLAHCYINQEERKKRKI